jgi:hypothetical protein
VSSSAMFTRLVDGPALGSTGTPVTVAVHAVIAVDASNAAVQMAFDLQPYRVGPAHVTPYRRRRDRRNPSGWQRLHDMTMLRSCCADSENFAKPAGGGSRAGGLGATPPQPAAEQQPDSLYADHVAARR